MKKTIFAALVAAAMLMAMLTLAGCQQQDTRPPEDPAEVDAFFDALDNGMDSWDFRPLVAVQIEGEATIIGRVDQTTGQIRQWAKESHAIFEVRSPDATTYNIAPYRAEHALFINELGNVVDKAFTAASYPTMEIGGVLYVADAGVMYQLSKTQPDPEVTALMASYVAEYDSHVNAVIKDEYRKNVTPDQTMAKFMEMKFWGPNSLWVMLTEGMDNWAPALSDKNYQGGKVVAAYDSPWNTSSSWYHNNVDMGTIAKNAPIVNGWFPSDVGEKLTNDDRIILGFPEELRREGVVYFPKLSAALSGNIGGGNGPSGPTNPTPGPVNPTNPTPAPVNPTPEPTNPTPTQKTLSSLTITPSTWSVKQGGSLDFKAEAIYSDGSREDVTSKATWFVNSGYGLSITGGKLTASATATVGTNYTVYATWSGKQSNNAIGAVTKGATEKTLANINVTPTTWTVVQGGSTSLKAEAVYSDGSKEDITSKGTWSINQGYGLSISGGKITASATATVGSNYSAYVEWQGKRSNISVGTVTAAAPKSATIRILVRDSESFATIDDISRQVEIGKTTTYTISASGAYKIVYGTMGSANVSPSGDYSITSPKVTQADVFYVYLVSKNSKSQDGVLEVIPSDLEPGTYVPHWGGDDTAPIEYDGDPEPGQGADWTDTAPVEQRPENGTPQAPDDFDEGSWSNPK